MAPEHPPGHSRKEGGVTVVEKMPVTHSCQKIYSHSCFIWTHLLLHSVDTGGISFMLREPVLSSRSQAS